MSPAVAFPSPAPGATEQKDRDSLALVTYAKSCVVGINSWPFILAKFAARHVTPRIAVCTANNR